jgi:hypothetical protein
METASYENNADFYKGSNILMFIFSALLCYTNFHLIKVNDKCPNKN